MYEAKKEYKGHKGKDEIKYHLPEWISILKEYLRKDYSENRSRGPAHEKNKKNVEDLL